MAAGILRIHRLPSPTQRGVGAFPNALASQAGVGEIRRKEKRSSRELKRQLLKPGRKFRVAWTNCYRVSLELARHATWHPPTNQTGRSTPPPTHCHLALSDPP